MADDVTLPGTGKSVATKEISSSHYQKMLITDQTGVDAFGAVTASPTANTHLARLKTISDLLDILDDWDESDRAKINAIVGQAGVAAGEGVPGVTVIRNIEAVNQLDFSGDSAPPINSVNAAITSAAISCENKKYIVLGPEYSDSAGTAPLLVFLLDHNVTQKTAPTSIVTPANLGFQGFTIETNYYSAEAIIIETKGAKEFKIRVNDTPSAGNVSVFAAVV